MAARKRTRRLNGSPTPLGREFARLSSWATADPFHDHFQCRRTVPAAELVVWTALPLVDCKHAVGPPTARPNPVLADDLVICSAFSPARIVALDRETGRLRWTLSMPSYGHAVTPGSVGSGLVYGGSCQEVLAVDTATGRAVWAFTPYGRKGETIYSHPAVRDGRLFVGDRRGHLYCLDAATGEPVWRVLTSRAVNNDVNSDPVVAGGVVAVGTNAGLAAGYDAGSGRAVWRHRLDGPCTHAVPAGDEAALFWTSGSACLVSVPDGTLLGRWRRRGHAIDQACVVGDLTLLVTRRRWGRDGETWPVAELRAYRGGTEVYAGSYRRWSGPTVRFEPATGRVYEATPYGVGVLDPVTGQREVVISFREQDGLHGRTGQPSVDGKRLYAVVEDGRVLALAHPDS